MTEKKYTHVIENYQLKKPFSSFLSGVAGEMGIPLWAYYVNRGQLISSFGVRNKNGAIMEFYPANLAYHYVSKTGFRTLVKLNGKVTEFFKEDNPNQKLLIDQDKVSIIEENNHLQIGVKITYFTLPNENVAALVRKVEIFNLNHEEKELEVVDGLAQILPSGIEYGAYKAISNLLQSWMSSIEESNHVFYKMRSSTGDQAEVSEVVDGNFYMTFGLTNKKYVSDYKLIFEEDTSLSTPYGLIQNDYETLIKMHQTHVNQVPCAMTLSKMILKDHITFTSLIGYAPNKEAVFGLEKHYDLEKCLEKEIENQILHQNICKPISTETNLDLFDAYMKQCYLDNVLRGGLPVVFETSQGRVSYYLYSRKHGDLERDYNFFHLEPSFYSQGNGNFRDVLQNRRNDIFFNPEIGDFNIYQFISLIQADGYNPLGIEGITFSYNGEISHFEPELRKILKHEFTPGMLATYFYHQKENVNDKMKSILKQSIPNIKANFGEGYWEDHFTYIYDLIESYLSVYPDYYQTLLFDKQYPFFKSPAKVLPRSQKYVLTKDGKVRQYGSVLHGHGESKWLENEDGIILVNLIGKLLTLIVNKYGHLDPFGIGLSYEANKPGWNDAANGIPGLFGSGVSEVFELIKLVKFIKKAILNYPDHQVIILDSTYEYAKKLSHMKSLSDFEEWDFRNEALESYREQLESTQKLVHLKAKQFSDLIELIFNKLTSGVEKAKKISKIYPTYLTYEVTDYEMIKDENGSNIISHYGLPTVKAKAFKLIEVPPFLEGPARYLKTLSSFDEAYEIYQSVKKTDIYDHDLKMYKTSGSLEHLSHEIGRLRAFTPGWLERESNFLHMNYKYLLGLIKSGLYDIFYEEIKNNLTCFMNPDVYGRSPIENSSFIATSNNPDPKKHGQGFVSRLTGSTSEVLSMWRYMFLGDQIFSVKDDLLHFELSPKLKASFFKEGIIKTQLFGKIECIYHNQTGFDTYQPNIKISKMILSTQTDTIEINHHYVVGEWAKKIRDKKNSKIELFFDVS